MYLLPSGASPPSINNPLNWGDTGLARKKDITKAWCDANVDVQLEGYLFDMRSPKRGLVPRVYCGTYDAALRSEAVAQKK